jgi:NCS2 family nucleobase:cation symporter-2
MDDRPPLVVTLLMGLQHIFVMSSTLALPVVIVKEIGGSMAEINALVCFSMIAAGIGTILQALKRGPIGSGYLCPNLCGPSYLGVSMQAAWLGGLPLMHGMTMAAGLFEVLFSRLVNRLKFLFPNQVTGMVVLMVGVALIPLGTSKFLGIEISGDPVSSKGTLAAALTLLAMIGVNIWSKGQLRLYCVLIGMVVGYLLSSLLGIMDQDDWLQIWRVPWFDLPWKGRGMFSFAFDWSMVGPFLIVAACASLKSFGNLTTCQKINDDDWAEPDVKNVGNGLLADGIAVFSGGLLGGMAVDTSASNVGLAAATGATSRWIALAAGALYVALAFCPKLTTLVVLMPAPAMGAILIFVTCFMLISGFNIITTTPLDVRKTFIVGASMIFGLSVDIIPEAYSQLHPWLKAIFSSSLTMATVMAIVLNQLFSLGSKGREPGGKNGEA